MEVGQNKLPFTPDKKTMAERRPSVLSSVCTVGKGIDNNVKIKIMNWLLKMLLMFFTK